MAKQIFNIPAQLFKEIEERFNFSAAAIDLKSYVIMRYQSEHTSEEDKSSAYVPIGFKFIWNDRERVFKFFTELAEQGFKVIREKKVINVIDKEPVTIQRHGKTILEEKFLD